MAKRWAEIAPVIPRAAEAASERPGASSAPPSPRKRGRCRSALSRSPIPIASPRTAAAAAAPSCSPTAAAPTSIRPRRWRASRSSRSAELTGAAAQGRIVLAAPITLAEIEARFADQIEEREDDRRSTPHPRSLRARRSAPARRASRWPSRPMPVDARRRDGAHCWRDGIAGLGLDRLPWTKALQQWRDRVHVPAPRRRRGMARPLRRGARRRRRRVARAVAARQDRARRKSPPTIWPTRSTLCCPGICAAGSTPRRRRISPRRPARAVPIDYEAEEGPKLAIRVQELFGLDRHPSIAGGRVPLVIELLVAGAPAGAGHARPAGLLARQLRGGEGRDARPLSRAIPGPTIRCPRPPPAAPSRAAT